jgi:CRP-like cAMP-binding protein
MRGPTSAFDTLHNYLSARGAAFSDEERTILDGAFVPTSLAAGAFFQRAGEPATQAAFVASGCMRIYVVDARGKEHILQFLPEDWWWSDTLSLTTGAPSQYFAQAIEGTDLLCIDPPSTNGCSTSSPPLPRPSEPASSATTPPRISAS